MMIGHEGWWTSLRQRGRTILSVLPAAGAILLLSLLAAPASAEQRVALVIGNGSYAHAPLLANPLNDAADIGGALERLGFKVTRIVNADQVTLRRGLQQFALAASASEMAAVFYAGHGIEVDRRNFLVPVDARLLSDTDVEFETVPLDLLMRAVERTRGLRLIILDACRDNPFAAVMQRSGATRSIGRGLARVEPSGETLVAYAAKEGTVAADGEGRNSPYTAALLAHLEEPGLRVDLMFRKVRDAVLASTGGRQEPFIYSSLSGKDTYLAVLPKPAQASTAPDPVDSAADATPASDGLTSEHLATKRLEAEQELLFWESVKDSQNPDELRAYLDRYPQGAYAVLARSRLDRMAVAPDDAETAPSSTAAVATAARDDPSTPQPSVPAEPAHEAPSAPVSAPAEPVLLDLTRDERRRVQIGLAALGFESGPEDGLFGPKTRAALGAWQEAKGYAATGVLTREQAGALIAAAGTEADAAAEERLAAEREFWSSVKESGDPADLEAYLKTYPGGVYEALARRRLDTLIAEEDNAAYGRARSEGTKAAYEAYLRAYPAGLHGAEAREAAARAAMRPGRVFRDCEVCPEMVVVPAGSFTMGSPASEEDRYEQEGPQHRVTIGRPFAVGKYEVTFAEWESCLDGGGCSGYTPSDEGWGRGGRPVANVSWNDAQSYVAWLSRKTGKRYRLLSESEWEYAARAGTTGPFHFGETISTNQANYDGSSIYNDYNTYDMTGAGVYRENTVPVGSFPPNGFGLHDMHGNVFEWVEDCWHDSYFRAPSDGRAWITGGDCTKRMSRGGAWAAEPENTRSAVRARNTRNSRDSFQGFRVARTLLP